jgi:hypothetical protein
MMVQVMDVDKQNSCVPAGHEEIAPTIRVSEWPHSSANVGFDFVWPAGNGQLE